MQKQAVWALCCAGKVSKQRERCAPRASLGSQLRRARLGPVPGFLRSSKDELKLAGLASIQPRLANRRVG
jgi:hypothetical protein